MFMATRLTILCITSDASKLEQIQPALLHSGHRVNIALDETTALEILDTAHGVDVIVICENMPQFAALNLITTIKNRPQLDATGVILCSSNDVLDLPIEHKAWHRVDVLLPAPCHTSELLDAIFESYMRRQGCLYRIAPDETA